MTTASDFSVGLAHKFCVAAAEAGWTPAELNRLTQDMEALRRFRELMFKHLIDLDSAPFIPEGWQVEEHKKGGKFEWDVTKVNLFVSVNQQQNSKLIQGHKLRKELESQKVFNANLLDFLLARPHLIPGKWKGKYIYFWGTIYRDSVGDLFVRYLSWYGGQWDWHWHYLVGAWDSSDRAAVLAS